MPSSAETRCPYQSRESIGDQRDHFLVPVLVCDYRSQSKTLHGVTGRERIASVKKLPVSAIVERPLAPGSEFEDLEYNQSIHQRLGAKQTRLTCFGVIRENS